jgi:phosphoribosylformimino-5-aminoimidazole carboxamide ribotide isomerase
MPLSLQVIPVLDVKAGRAVHAVGGQRDHYGPVRSVLHESSDPVELARAYREHLGLTSLYLADLDAIDGATPGLALYRRLLDMGTDLWLDAGLRDQTTLAPLLSLEISTIIAGLETLRSPAALAAIVERAGPERIVFSLDLVDGQPVCSPHAGSWPVDPLTICRDVRELGVRRVILLDLARVGRGAGIGTSPLIESLAAECQDVEITVGGGVSSVADLAALNSPRVSAVLIASALHDGRITAGDLQRLTKPIGETTSKS